MAPALSIQADVFLSVQTKLAGKVFRIGHLGHFNDLTLAGTLAGVQMGLNRAGIKHDPNGIQAALEVLGQ